MLLAYYNDTSTARQMEEAMLGIMRMSGELAELLNEFTNGDYNRITAMYVKYGGNVFQGGVAYATACNLVERKKNNLSREEATKKCNNFLETFLREELHMLQRAIWR